METSINAERANRDVVRRLDDLFGRRDRILRQDSYGGRGCSTGSGMALHRLIVIHWDALTPEVQDKVREYYDVDDSVRPVRLS